MKGEKVSNLVNGEQKLQIFTADIHGKGVCDKPKELCAGDYKFPKYTLK